jgi:3-oxoacyl-[acyl-carrier protein] reductase
MDLRAKTAIITGGGRGIGKATAIELAKEGCNIVVSSRNAKELQIVAEEAKSFGVEALALPLDLSQQYAINELVSKSIEKFGSIDILINNAGIIIPRPFLEVSIEE